jgi:cytochrome c oxidase subunit 2
MSQSLGRREQVAFHAPRERQPQIVALPRTRRRPASALERQTVCWGNEIHELATVSVAAWGAARAAPTRKGLERSGRKLIGVLGVTTPLLLGCAGPQSALAPAGRAAERIADLFWGMTAGATLIWFAVVGLSLYATCVVRKQKGRDSGRLLILGGGVILPTVVLTGLLIYSLAMLPSLLAPAAAGSLRIEVIGHQWWWRVRYLRDGAAPIELANEVHLPVGEAVHFELESRDVIHSFWIPALGGKVDMIPGRRTRLTLQPTRTGAFRGPCAEYCGTSHAIMSFWAIVQERGEFNRWLAGQAANAVPPPSPVAARGEAIFLQTGCGACHTVRGTTASGVIAPDLTHVGGRRSIGAGALSCDSQNLRRWLAHTGEVKPGVQMPTFGMLPGPDLQALAAYLEGLK